MNSQANTIIHELQERIAELERERDHERSLKETVIRQTAIGRNSLRTELAAAQSRITELERERIDSQAQLMVERRELLAKLAAAQATIQQMRDKFEKIAGFPLVANASIKVLEAANLAIEALALPADRTALDAAVAAALSEREFVHAESSRIYARLAVAVRSGADDAALASLLRTEVAKRA